ncbi:unnamed protein product [Caenorhabditis sp. 36 PRJEB53466]|nr:unnamed protein product [Caenorhabditis sp. 36 PRJEB53466]
MSTPINAPGQVSSEYWYGSILMTYKMKEKRYLCAILFVDPLKVHVIVEETNEWKTPFEIATNGPDQEEKSLVEKVIDVTDTLISNKVWDHDVQIEKMLIVCVKFLQNDLSEFANCFYTNQMGQTYEPKIPIRSKLEEMIKYYAPDGRVAIGVCIGSGCEYAVVSKNDKSKSMETVFLNYGNCSIMRMARERIIARLSDSINDPPPGNPYSTILDIFKRTLCPDGFHESALFAEIHDESDLEELHILVCVEEDHVTDLTVLEGFADQFVSMPLVKRIRLYRPTVDDLVTAVSAFNQEARTNFEVKSEKWRETYRIDYFERGYNIVSVDH